MTFEDGVNDLEAVVASRGLKRFALYGHWLGAATSIAYAIRHPDQVSHLILYGRLFFASDEAGFITGVDLAVDAGLMAMRG